MKRLVKSSQNDGSFYSYIASKLRQGITSERRPDWHLEYDFDFIPDGEWSEVAETAYYNQQFNAVADRIEQGYESGRGWRLEYSGDPMGY